MTTNTKQCSLEPEQYSTFQMMLYQFQKMLFPAIKEWITVSGVKGLSEFEILKKLNQYNSESDIIVNFSSPQSLFPIHFLLFHSLYQWQEELSKSKSHNQRLIISALEIKLLHHQPGTELGQRDELRHYYLDINNLLTLSEEGIDSLINEFWGRFCATDKLTDAFTVLELTPTKDFVEVKTKYRKMMASCHPDKGGCHTKAQNINEAYRTIQVAFGK